MVNPVYQQDEELLLNPFGSKYLASGEYTDVNSNEFVVQEDTVVSVLTGGDVSISENSIDYKASMNLSGVTLKRGALIVAPVGEAFKSITIDSGSIMAYNCVVKGQKSVSDSDAAAFFERVADAGGSLSTTEQDAVNQLVLDMKANGIWDSMKAIYPMVGASAAACAQNLKSSSFTGSFSSGWTFASTGITPNGVTTFMNTNLNPTVSINNANDGHLSYYSRTESTGNFIEMGTLDGGTAFDLVIKFSNVAGACINMIDTNVFSYTGTTRGLFIGSQNNTANVRKWYRNNSFSQTQTVAQNSQPNTIISVGARGANFNSFGTNRECAFASIGTGLSDIQASNFYNAVQAFQTTLSRQV